jgi:endonuclease III
MNIQEISQLLLNNRSEDISWVWLERGKEPTKKEANKFMLSSILDFQMNVDRVVENARRLSEDILGDPDNLWHEITKVNLEEWNKQRSNYKLHRFPSGHTRVWKIGKQIVENYGGDSRNIWNDNQPSNVILCRLEKIGAGKQISRMITGALIDTGQITAKGDVKVDIHVKRVLGRILQGKEFTSKQANEVIEITRKMNSSNPWLLDRPLYFLGKSICTASVVTCPNCFMHTQCVFFKENEFLWDK